MRIIKIDEQIIAVCFELDETNAIKRYAGRHNMSVIEVMKAAVEAGLRKFGYRG